ncbi:MAG TPA: (2Fe-2S) ferredoxin domain-containing protein [Burkholderiales bacterium]|nr:(2Fe-2S) ferredoxin domain-containing protein [Burkholderiales bacterium]
MSHYEKHVFFCLNQREKGEDCCNNHDATAMRLHAKERIKALGLNDKIRINSAGCLGRCGEGPVIVVYPEETWYTYVDIEDVDEIIDSHLLKNEAVARLKI